MFLILELCSLKWNWKSNGFLLFLGVITTALVITLTQPVIDTAKKDIYQKALLNNPYEMKIQYEYKDSLLVPVDTVFYLKIL